MLPARDAATVHRSGLLTVRMMMTLTAANDNRRPSVLKSLTTVTRLRPELAWLHGLVTGAMITALVLGIRGACF